MESCMDFVVEPVDADSEPVTKVAFANNCSPQVSRPGRSLSKS